jgi:hypothetical protein
MASAKGFDFICFRQIVRRFLADCRNKYRRETSGVATLTLPLPTLLTAGVLASNAAVVTSIQLGINRIYIETDY